MSGPCWPLSGETYPDDDIYIPCNQTAVDNGGHSACCAPGDRCLTNGLCTNDPGGNVYWRDGCTDRTWKDPACPNYCPSTDGSNEVGNHLAFKCSNSRAWCCKDPNFGLGDDDLRCCNNSSLTFKADNPSIYTTVTSSDTLVSASSSSSSTSTAEQQTTSTSITPIITVTSIPTTTSRPTDSNTPTPGGGEVSTSLKIGLASGIPSAFLLGVALVLGFWWYRRKHSRGIQADGRDGTSHIGTNEDHLRYDGTNMIRKTQPDEIWYHEAPADRHCVEVDGTTVLAELGTGKQTRELDASLYKNSVSPKPGG